MMRRPRFLFYCLLTFLTASWITFAQPGLTRQLVVDYALSARVSETDRAVTDVIAQSSIDQAAQLEQEARSSYNNGHYDAAANRFQAAAEAYATAGDDLQQAVMLSNLSLTYQQLGEWSLAEEAINAAIARLQAEGADQVAESVERHPQHWSALAQSYNIQAQIQFSQGQAEAAEATWEQAGAAYQAADDLSGLLTSQINQAQALQALGFYPDAIALLSAVVERLDDQPDTALKATALQNLGAAQLTAGDLDMAQRSIEQSLALAQRLGLGDTESAALISLGDLAKQQQAVGSDIPLVDALANYEQAAIAAQSPLAKVEAQIKQLYVLIQLQHWQEAQLLWPSIQVQLAQLPLSRRTIYANVAFVTRLQDLQNALTTIAQAALQSSSADATNDDSIDNLAVEGADRSTDESFESLESSDRAISPTTVDTALLTNLLAQLPPRVELAQQLLQTRQQAHQLGDVRAEAYIIGQLAHLYEESGQVEEAEDLTRQALALSQSRNAPDVAYQWQAQLGRLRKAQNDRAGAIAAYSESVATLQSLRSDLAAASREFQFSFRKDVEPIYRELVDLLLSDETNNPDNLEKAREVIESLQLAELDNYFREACLDAESVQIDTIDSQAAVVYTVVLPERLEVLVRLPNGEWIHHAKPVTQAALAETVDQLADNLSNPLNARNLIAEEEDSNRFRSRSEGATAEISGGDHDALAFMPHARQLYDWMIRPIADQLAAAQPSTLVFVLDDQLRKVPMSVLNDGEQYLVEKYAIALTPGLQLLESAPLTRREVRAIVAGVSESRTVEVRNVPLNFPQLDGVKAEVETIQSLVNSEVLFNEEFQTAKLENTVSRLSFPVVHLATHGVFSSSLEDTFVLAWDGKLNANQLSALLQSSELVRDGAIELLVLSACETAAGDDRASLGLAGIAVRSGARSTLATLWQVDDLGTTQFMKSVYQTLSSTTLSKAEVVRQAQLELLKRDDGQQHPYFWAPFVLIGNWI